MRVAAGVEAALVAIAAHLAARAARRRVLVLQRVVLDAAQVWNASLDVADHVRQRVPVPRLVVVLFGSGVSGVSANSESKVVARPRPQGQTRNHLQPIRPRLAVVLRHVFARHCPMSPVPYLDAGLLFLLIETNELAPFAWKTVK